MTESIKTQTQSRIWRKDGFLICTDPALFPILLLTEIFNSDAFYWANAPTPEAMRAMLENSLSFGVYRELAQEEEKASNATPSSSTGAITSGRSSSAKLEFVGMARCITDFVTFSYLTDVWVQPGFQGRGLGRWLVSCVGEVMESMPFLRRHILFTSDWDRSVPFYEEILGVSVVEARRGEGLAIMSKRGPANPLVGQPGP